MTTQTPQGTRPVPPAVAVGVNIVGAALGPLIGLIGLSVSFQTIERMARLLGLPGQAYFYPLGIDLGILALIVGDWMFAVRGRNGWPLRVLAWALTGFTVWVNWNGAGADSSLDLAALGLTADSARLLQSGLHAIMPVLWVVMVEAVRRLVLHDAKQRSGAAEREVPLARWMLAPVRTGLLYRRMRLWGIESYRLALAFEDARVFGMGLVRARRGWRWRWYKTPRLLRVRLTSGRLPDQVRETIEDLVRQGRTAGWERTVYWWVIGELEADEEASADTTAEPPTDAAVEGAPSPSELPSGAPLQSPPPVGLGAPHWSPLGEFTEPPTGAPSRAPSGAPTGGGSEPPSRAPSGTPSSTPTGGGSEPPSSGATGGASRARRPGTGKKIADTRHSVDGMSDEDILALIVDFARDYEDAHDGAEITPTALRNKYLKVGPQRARRLVETHYGSAANVVRLAKAE